MKLSGLKITAISHPPKPNQPQILIHLGLKTEKLCFDFSSKTYIFRFSAGEGNKYSEEGFVNIWTLPKY